MVDSKLAPLAFNVPIVDPKTGYPTPYFAELVDRWLKENAITDDVAEAAVTQADLAALELDDLADVDTSTTPPDDGQALIWDDANSEWVPGDVASSGGANPFAGALVKKAADETAANYSAGVYVPWTAEEYDTHNIHDNSTNNSRLTVPSGVTRVRLAFNITVTSTTVTASDFFRAQVHKNGAFVIGCNYTIVEISGTPAIGISGTTGVMTVASGDYFQLWFDTESDTSITLDSTNCWFSMEIVEDSVANTTNRGTSFPSSPAVGDGYFRTDRGIEYYWDGTRWLSTQVFVAEIRHTDGALPLTATSFLRGTGPYLGTYSLYAERVTMSTHNTAATPASNYFTYQFSYLDGAASTNIGSALSSQNDVINTWFAKTGTATVVVPSTADAFMCVATEVGAASTYALGSIAYRLIG